VTIPAAGRRGLGAARAVQSSVIHTRLSGGSRRVPRGPASKMGATARLRKSHPATACSAAHMSGPGMWRRKQRSSLRFSQPPVRRLKPGPTKRWDRPASRQNPNPQPPVRRLTQGPAGPCFEDGCNREVAEIPSRDRLFGGSSRADEEMGSTGKPAKPNPQPPVRRLTRGVPTTNS